jgi:Tol biopolymer transport system component
VENNARIATTLRVLDEYGSVLKEVDISSYDTAFNYISPDGYKIAGLNLGERVSLLSISSQKPVAIASDFEGARSPLVWSPGGRWLGAFSMDASFDSGTFMVLDVNFNEGVKTLFTIPANIQNSFILWLPIKIEPAQLGALMR